MERAAQDFFGACGLGEDEPPPGAPAGVPYPRRARLPAGPGRTRRPAVDEGHGESWRRDAEYTGRRERIRPAALLDG
ncbi:hypothetical protein ACGRHY_24645 [Streptomyces sp. HK10]|uniref:hypothetical protein n=1 Tax=Streptomyces sp. HK10 TaxID=3373255 RepID=UPI00374A3405